MEGEQPGRGEERLPGISVTFDLGVHQEHSPPRPQTHHPDHHRQSHQEVWDTLPVVSHAGR